MSQEALDERKELLGLIKGQERGINECEKNIGYFERRIRKVKSHPWYQSEDGTTSMRQQRSIKKAKPSSAKGVYFKKISVSSTMGPGLTIDAASVDI